MARTRGSHDIASQVRGAFLRAAKMAEEDGRPLSLILLEQLQERPLDTLRAIAQFVPKEMLVEAEVTTRTDEMTDAELVAYAKQLGEQLGGIRVSFADPAETTH